MASYNVTVELVAGSEVHRRGFNGNFRTSVINSARFWVTQKMKDLGPQATIRSISGSAGYADFVTIGGAQEEDFEPPTCRMCDGYHGGRFCPLEDTGWMQSFEPRWAQ